MGELRGVVVSIHHWVVTRKFVMHMDTTMIAFAFTAKVAGVTQADAAEVLDGGTLLG